MSCLYMLGIIHDCFNELCCGSRKFKSKAGVIINHIEQLALDEYHELVKNSKQIDLLWIQ